MRNVVVLLVGASVLGMGTIAGADVFKMGAGLTSLQTVTVGDKGNAGELSGKGSGIGGNGPDRVCGAVDYAYRIGRYEVTAAQYTVFLNAVAKTDTYELYNSRMGEPEDFWGCNIRRSGSSGSYKYSVDRDWANRPVNYVSFWNACRFANWLHNGQPKGPQDASTTERGAYTLDGYNGADGQNIQRNTDWKWAVTSEDEWYKAAYYKGGGTDSGYWDYPIRNDRAPINRLADPTDPGNNATFFDFRKTGNGDYTIGAAYYRTEVGAHENSQGPYGTFDQAGNVLEWNESRPYNNAFRGLRGGTFNGYSDDMHAGYSAIRSLPTIGDFDRGFRVVGVLEKSERVAPVEELPNL